MGSKYYNNKFYTSLDEEIKIINSKFRNYQICLIGDFNARTGQLEPYINTEAINNTYEKESYGTNTRTSKDVVINCEGEKLLELCSVNNLMIANGTLESDLKGEFTFANKQGKSVIDYLCIESNAIHIVKNFKIEELGCSDHMILNVEIVGENYQGGEQDKNMNEKMKINNNIGWSDENKTRFDNKINYEVSNLLLIGIKFNVNNGNMEKALDLLYFLVSRGGIVINKKRQRNNNRIKFYDEECVNKRKELRNKFKKWRNNEEESRHEYIVTKNQYRILLNKKKEI